MTEPARNKRSFGSGVIKMIVVFAQMGTIGVLVAQIAGRFGRAHYLLDLANHPQLQYLFATGGAFVLFALFRKWRWTAIAFVAMASSGWQVLPWQFGKFDNDSKAAGPKFRLLITNVLSGNRNIEALRAMVAREQPDVIVMIEADGWWIEKLTDLRQSHPHGLGLPRNDNFGVAVFSRIPMLSVENVPFEPMGVPSIVGTVEVGEQSVRLIATHPLPPASAGYFHSRNAQLKKLAELAGQENGPFIVAGDLNITMWSPVYSDLVTKGKLRNARKGFGVLPSWPTGFPAIMRIPIDHCLHNDQVQVLDCRLGEPIGSDHLPLIIDVTIPNSQ